MAVAPPRSVVLLLEEDAEQFSKLVSVSREARMHTDTGSRLLERAAAACLLVAAGANLAGVVMFTIRGGAAGGDAPTHAFLVAERSLFMAAMMLSALGFCLLDGRMQSPGAEALMRLGTIAYLAAGIVGITAETLELAGLAVYSTIVAYVVLSFIGQAVIGGALVASTLVPRWIAWATVLWNVCWLAGLVLVSPQDVSFPILHLVMPVFIGVALIRRSRLGPPPAARWRRAVPGRRRDAVRAHPTATTG